MKRWILFFCFLGMLGVVSAVTGITSFTADLGGTSMTRHSDLLSRCFAASSGGLLLFFAWAIHRRLKWIWRLMFIFFGACLADGVVTTYLDLSLQYPKQPTRDTILYTALIGLCMVIVGSYWMYQWYKQKAYFYADEING